MVAARKRARYSGPVTTSGSPRSRSITKPVVGPVGTAIIAFGNCRHQSRICARSVDAACTQPARIFGLYPRKGIVAPGSDADLVVWDPSTPSTLTLDGIGDGLDWTPYDGIEVPGRVRDVLARGERVVADGSWVGDEHRGEYLPVSRVLETA